MNVRFTLFKSILIPWCWIGVEGGYQNEKGKKYIRELAYSIAPWQKDAEKREVFSLTKPELTSRIRLRVLDFWLFQIPSPPVGNILFFLVSEVFWHSLISESPCNGNSETVVSNGARFHCLNCLPFTHCCEFSRGNVALSFLLCTAAQMFFGAWLGMTNIQLRVIFYVIKWIGRVLSIDRTSFLGSLSHEGSMVSFSCSFWSLSVRFMCLRSWSWLILLRMWPIPSLGWGLMKGEYLIHFDSKWLWMSRSGGI